MPKKPLNVGVDFDGVMCSLAGPWSEYLVEKLGIETPKEIARFITKFYNADNYNICEYLSKYYKRSDLFNYVNNFWLGEDIYDAAELLPNTKQVINKLLSMEHCRVIIISHCKPEHKKSKLIMLRRYGLDYIPFIDTKYKQFVNVDIMIDDCPDVHHKMKSINPEYTGIHFNYAFPRIVANLEDVKYTTNNWENIEKILDIEYTNTVY